MSILEKIKGIEDCIIEISDNQKVILEALENNKEKLDRLLAKGSDWSTKEHMEVDLKNAERIVTTSDEEFRKEEEVIMDLKGVQCIATTEKAILVTKKGYQKWIPISQISENTKTIEEGDFLEDIELTENAKKWIPDKPWDKYKVVKG